MPRNENWALPLLGIYNAAAFFHYFLPHQHCRNENSFAKDYDGVAGDEAALKKFKEMENAQQKQKKRKWGAKMLAFMERKEAPENLKLK